MTDSKELFRALELAHYAQRFRGNVFVIALPAATAFQELLLDFKVLAGYHIQLVLVTQDPAFNLERIISLANQRGARFQLSLLTDLLFRPEEEALQLDFPRVHASLAEGRTPVIAYHGSLPAEPAEDAGIDPTFALAAEVAARLGASKLFLVSPLAAALREALPRTSVQAGDMEGLAETLHQAGLAHAEPLCAFVQSQLARGIPDLVLLEGRRAHLFQEVFTYDGAGILFTGTRASRIRPAQMKDVTDITLLLRAEIEAGRILPINEDAIAEAIDSYWIYEIDGMPAGLACLKRFGTDAELAQFATLPRYRGKGRARELAAYLAEQARAQGMRRVFALSIDARMWAFFRALGFEEVERAELPDDWRRGYDFSRPSRAFRKELQ